MVNKKFFNIPGNNILGISKDLTISVLSKEHAPEIENYCKIDGDYITLDMYKKKRRVELRWLMLVSRFCLYLPEGFEEYVFNYRFSETVIAKFKGKNKEERDFSNRLPLVAYFKDPVYYMDKFRIIPEFPRYAASENKEIIEISTGKKVNRDKDYVGYPSISLFSDYFGKLVSRNIHTLIALTWIDNDDYKSRPLVNHIDGDKSNYSADNLEWVSYSENLIHAYKTGLRTDNHPVKVYDKKQDTIRIYYSITEAFKEMGLKARANLEHYFRERNGLYISGKNYEIKYLSDNTPFLLQTMPLDKALEEYSNRFKRNRVYQAIDLDNREEVVGPNGLLQKELGLSEAGVTGICRKKTIYVDKNKRRWIIRDYSTDPIDEKDYTNVENTKVAIERVNLRTGEVERYSSLREAGRFNRPTDPKTIVNAIKKNSIYKKRYIFRYTKD